MIRRRALAAVLALATVGPVACSDGNDTAPDTAAVTTTSPPTTTLVPAPPELVAAVQAAVEGAPPGCDPLAPLACLLPFPSDVHTVAADTPTGRRVNLPAAGMPVNVSGVAVDPTEWNRNDGFSPGATVLLAAPGVSPEQSGLAPSTDIGRSLDEDAPVVLLDAETGERVPWFAELDAGATTPADQLLIIRPARNFAEGHRIVVGVRGLVDAAGAPIPPSAAFVAYRDGLDTGIDTVEDRRAHTQDVFARLEAAGIERDELYLAWDFTIASTDSLAGRMLSMRDQAFESLGEEAPRTTITAVHEAALPGIARVIDGRVSVPHYLSGDTQAGSRLVYGTDGRPEPQGTLDARFLCIVPDQALETPGRPVIYGHGLMGVVDEVTHEHQLLMARAYGMVFCTTLLIGMAREDIPYMSEILQDFSRFPSMPDRMQQGILNTLFLGRAMLHPDGLASHPAFQGAGGRSVIDHTELFYDSNSQGGVVGGAITAVSLDVRRAVLGVPGMNHSTLLERSADFDGWWSIFRAAYPRPLDQTLLLGLAQMLWDRGENNGYAQHLIGDPYPGTPSHEVLVHVAFGDHQMPTLTAEILARTAGIPIQRPVFAPGRSADVEVGWGLDTLERPSEGSALVVFDSGSPAPPPDNQVHRAGRDSHQDPRHHTPVLRQKDRFLRPDGLVVDVCDGEPCTAPPAPLRFPRPPW